MLFRNVSILGVAHVEAPERVTSLEIEAGFADNLRQMRVGPGLLETLTGITARRFWPVGTQPSDAATLAGRLVLERAELDPARVGLLLNTSVCRDFIEPSTACIVHRNLGLPESCSNFDIANACLGFLNGMEVAGQMIERGLIDYALIVDGESSRFVVESTLRRLAGPEFSRQAFRENFATLTLGSGSAAMILARSELAPGRPRFTGSVTLAATSHSHLCRGQTDGMTTDTSGLLEAGVALAQRTFARAQAELGWTPAVLDELVLHQVSRSHTEKLVAALGLPVAKSLAIFPEYGNVGPAAVPTVLSMAVEQGRIQPGHRVALMGIGSGLNCSMAEIQW